MTMRAYDETYIEEVMDSLGSMLDYAVNGCGEDLDGFYMRFISSSIPGRIERRNPRYLAGLSGTELAFIVAAETGLVLPVMKEYVIDRGSPEFWTGWAIAYIQWYNTIGFEAIDSRWLPIMELYSRFQTLHEADLSKILDFFERRLSSSGGSSGAAVKAARKASGLTQKELAAKSGSNLRAIRSYEQGQVDIGKASAREVLNLCSVIGCSPERLLFQDFK